MNKKNKKRNIQNNTFVRMHSYIFPRVSRFVSYRLLRHDYFEGGDTFGNRKQIDRLNIQRIYCQSCFCLVYTSTHFFLIVIRFTKRGFVSSNQQQQARWQTNLWTYFCATVYVGYFCFSASPGLEM
jgi:hypothetical protein